MRLGSAQNHSIAEAWFGADFARLRAALEGGVLPAQHCEGCIRFCERGLDADAPLMREYGALGLLSRDSRIRALVVRIPAGGEALTAGVHKTLRSELGGIQHLAIEGAEPIGVGAFAEALASLRASAERPSLLLRIARVGALSEAVAALDGLRVAEIEVDLSHGDLGELESARRLARTIGAPLRAVFVLTPLQWFEFEEVARACGEEPVVPLDLRLYGRSREIPLLHLAVDDLTIVRNVVSSCWDRLGNAARPRSLKESGFDLLGRLLIMMLQHRAQVALDGAASNTAPASLALPPVDHAWFRDPARREWWLRHLFGQGHTEAVQRWILSLLASERGAEALRTQVVLRVLCHRVAAERRAEPVMEALQKLYADARRRSTLAKADEAFAQEFDLSPFGGPWAQSLGITASSTRKKPFAIGKPRAARGACDVTVLIPSFRHERYVVDCIRSVLAQDYPGISVLVVDDRSPDGTVDAARTITDPRLEVRVNDRNLGLGNSVLQALESVTTPFVALLNSDDLFHPSRIGRCRQALLDNPGAQLVTTGLSLVDANGGELRPDNVSAVLDGRLVSDWVHWYERVTPPEDLPEEGLFPRLLESNFLATSSNLVARTDWLRKQSESLQSLKYCLDWQLFLQAALEGALCHIHEPLAAYRLHSSNTVWFREGRRWSYYLEVNRVASAALSRFALQMREQGERGVVRVLDAVSAHLARNRETDGYALFLNSALGGLQLDGLAETSDSVQHGIQQLNRSAESVRETLDLAASLPPPEARQRDAWRVLLGDLAVEHLRIERGGRVWLEGYAESLEGRLRDCWSGRNAIESEKQSLNVTIEGLRKGIEELERRVAQIPVLEDEKLRLVDERTELQRQAVRQKSDLATLRADADALRRDRDAVRAEIEVIRDDNSALRADLEAVRSRSDVLAGELDGAHKDASAARALGERLASELQHERIAHAEADARGQSEQEQHGQTKLALDAERRAHEDSRAKLDAESTAHRQALGSIQRLEAAGSVQREELAERARRIESIEAQAARLSSERDELEQKRSGLLAEVVRMRDERQALLRSREYRWGNFFWNKLPLGYVSRRCKKWYRRMLDLKNRGRMWLSRLFRRPSKAQGTAVVAACWQWPIYSHTFVYQEMLGLTHMGLDLKMFHWELGDMGQLHKAFDYLKDHRVQIQPVWENHLRDKEHFEKTKPGRLREFLQRVSKATGKSVEELEKEPIVLQGCTFARMAELAGAKYLHSYFFYDQSFMVMQAAWLLDIPRGVSCYADHMLDDYPWKLVPLQVELASVVVATSARIKRELSAKSGGVHDDKIIVKPNGVDGARFPAFDRPLRKKDEPFEVISISRVEPKKGLIHLVEAIAELKQRGHNVIAHVVGSKDLHSKGSAEYAEQFDRRIQELGVGDRIVQHGMMKQEDLAPILKKCRAFVAPYVELGSGDKDGIPTAMLEGLASGLPVVTTDSGSILEVVDNGVEGIVVAQRDSKAFAEALLRLVADPELERRMAKASRARFDKEFDIRVTEKRLHERVAALVAKAKARR